MIYEKRLPAVRHLLILARQIQFPATREKIQQEALGSGVTEDMIEFLGLFPSGLEFDSKVDFMTTCEELEMLINQERNIPRETTIANKTKHPG